MMYPGKNTHAIQFFSFLFGIGLVIGVSSCRGATDFLSSAFIPHSRGYVKVSTDRHEQYVIKVNLKNLRSPEQTTTESSYVVWMITEGGVTEKIGLLESSNFLFTKIYSTTFKLESRLTPAKIYITAEDNHSIPNPNSEIVFSTSTFRE